MSGSLRFDYDSRTARMMLAILAFLISTPVVLLWSAASILFYATKFALNALRLFFTSTVTAVGQVAINVWWLGFRIFQENWA